MHTYIVRGIIDLLSLHAITLGMALIMGFGPVLFYTVWMNCIGLFEVPCTRTSTSLTLTDISLKSIDSVEKCCKTKADCSAVTIIKETCLAELVAGYSLFDILCAYELYINHALLWSF